MLQTILSHWTLILTVITGVYEVIARALPTSKDVTIIGNVISILQKISDVFNNKK